MFLLNEFWCAVIAGLKERFDEATRRNDVKSIVLTGSFLFLFLFLFFFLFS